MVVLHRPIKQLADGKSSIGDALMLSGYSWRASDSES
jgi:hypothetical protein